MRLMHSCARFRVELCGFSTLTQAGGGAGLNWPFSLSYPVSTSGRGLVAGVAFQLKTFVAASSWAQAAFA